MAENDGFRDGYKRGFADGAGIKVQLEQIREQQAIREDLEAIENGKDGKGDKKHIANAGRDDPPKGVV